MKKLNFSILIISYFVVVCLIVAIFSPMISVTSALVSNAQLNENATPFPTPATTPTPSPTPATTPTPSPTPTTTPTSSPTPTTTPTFSPTPTATPTSSPTPATTSIHSSTPTTTPIHSPTPITTPIHSPTPITTSIHSSTPTTTSIHSPTPTTTPTPSPTLYSSSDTSSSGYGRAHLIKSKTLPNQSNEVSRQVADTAETLGLKDIKPQIEGKVVKENIISGPSKSISFFIGFVGTLFLIFVVLSVKK
jgi:outer membrane biosynthesis protein TonB